MNVRDLLGMAVTKRASGRTWFQVRDDLIFYAQGLGYSPRLQGEGPDYTLSFRDGQVFYHRANGEYGCHTEGEQPVNASESSHPTHV